MVPEPTMTTHSHRLRRELALPAAACALTACAWGLLIGLVPADLILTTPWPAVTSVTLFGAFLAIALAQRPRPLASQVIVKTGAPRAEKEPPIAVPAEAKKAA